MPAPPSPVVRRRHLAAQLRRLRDQSGLTGEEASRRLRWSASKISRIETAKTGVKVPDVRRLLDLYGVTGDQHRDLVELALQADVKGWWESYSDVIDPVYLDFISMEAEAHQCLEYQNSFLPGLLQIPEYARGILTEWGPVMRFPRSVKERRLEIRLRRQELLRRQEPLLLHAIVDEVTLVRGYADPAVKRKQLRHLLEVSELPNLTLQVLPLEGVEHLGNAIPFILLQFAKINDVQFDDVIFFEQITSTLESDDEEVTHKYFLAFEEIKARALQPGKSLDLISKRLREA